MIYRNNWKNQEFDKEVPQNFRSERAAVAGPQGASVNENSEKRPTMSKTDSSSCFGIKTIFEEDSYPGRVYPDVIAASIKALLPDLSLLEAQPPIFRWFWRDGYLSLHFVCRHRLNIGKFFYEMIHRWLLPGRRLDVAAFFSSDFKLSEEGRLFTLAEMAIRLGRDVDRTHVEHNLRVIETEIRLGMVSVYHASRLLETHHISAQAKNGILQEKISKLIQRNPEEIDYDIFGELQHFIVMSKDEFKIPRDPHHLSRIVVLFYLFRKSIEREVALDKRHIRLKMTPVQLDVPWGKKTVLAICMGVNFIRNHELFEERHFLRAIQNGIAGVRAVNESYFVNEANGIQTVYIEIEKESGEEIFPSEIQKLRQFLPSEVKRSIEVPLKSLFMPRNEEEIIRYIVTLSGQLRFVKDLPQAIFIFDEQKEGDLYFTIIVVRILFSDSLSIQTLFRRDDTVLTYIPDRVKRIGMLRKKHPKEATVFRVKLSSFPFLRDDQSVDLFRARQTVVQELQKIIGEVRDYNGGMIAKQIELFEILQNSFEENSRADHRLLESFFHALYPIESRSIVPPAQLKKLFLLWKKLLSNPSLKIVSDQDEEAVFCMGRAGHIAELDPVDFQEMQLITARPDHEEKFLGYLFFSKDEAERHQFISQSLILDVKVQT